MPREIIQFQCTECKNRNYSKTKNKKTTTERLEMKKFCPLLPQASSRTRDEISGRFAAQHLF